MARTISGVAAKQKDKGKPFIDDGKLYLEVTMDRHRITSFKARYKDSEKIFEVKKNKITETWINLEKWLDKMD